MAFRPSCLLLVSMAFLASAASAQPPIPIPGLRAEVQVIRDKEGIPHISAQSEHDLILMQGWVHARDRLFQMDFRRRQASGTLAELVGDAALAGDVQLRILGLRRAAERSWPLLSPETQVALQAYAAGVNAFVAAYPLPPEYAVLERTFDPWTPVDSLAVGKLIAFGLSFDLDDIARTETLFAYQAAGAVAGFDGEALFFEDTNRSAPFDPAATVPDASQGATSAQASTRTGRKAAISLTGAAPRPDTLAMAGDYLERLRALPEIRGVVRFGEDPRGSNEWAVAGEHTVSGRPLIANDPHLDLGTPSTFYQNHLRADPADLDVIGGSFAGVPYVILGQNRHIAWGATVNPMDVTDVYQEQVVPTPSGLSTVYLGNLEPIIPIPQVFRVNLIGDGEPDNLRVVPPDGVNVPSAVLIVPRRNDGPIVALDVSTGAALSIQYTGFSGTREIQAFRAWNLADTLDDFVTGLQSFDFGSENWAYADTSGNIAYFTSAELPIREDLQAGFVAGLPPYFIRNGQGGNEWLPVSSPQPGQAVPFEVLPFAEMPQIVNPPAGFFVNANNDPAGVSLDNNPLNQLRPDGGIFYLNPGHDMGNRAGRITQQLERKLAEGPVGPEDMQEVQADVVLLDAQVFTPLIVRAFGNARHGQAHPRLRALAKDRRVREAVGRLATWDHSTPTGIPEGYDASDDDGELTTPGAAEIHSSVAATIYALWRGRIVGNTIDKVLDAYGLPKPGRRGSMTALRHLFDTFDERHGIGASGLDFFEVADVEDPATRRDIKILQSLVEALDLLASDAFADAFGRSTDQDDYRWGLLHRIVLAHPLGGPFSIPPAGGSVPPPLGDLPGFPVDGGFEVPDASRHNLRAADSHSFMFDAGPSRRYVGEVRRPQDGIRGESSIPGGASGVLGSPFYDNLLGRWLTNDTHPLRQDAGRIAKGAVEALVFAPAAGG